MSAQQLKAKQQTAAPPKEPCVVFKLCGSLESLQIIRPDRWFKSVLHTQREGQGSMEEHVLRRMTMHIETTIFTFHFDLEECEIQRPFQDLYEVFGVGDLLGKAICLHARQRRKRPAVTEQHTGPPMKKRVIVGNVDAGPGAGGEPRTAAPAPQQQDDSASVKEKAVGADAGDGTGTDGGPASAAPAPQQQDASESAKMTAVGGDVGTDAGGGPKSAVPAPKTQTAAASSKPTRPSKAPAAQQQVAPNYRTKSLRNREAKGGKGNPQLQ